MLILVYCSSFFFFSSRRRHTRFDCDWSSDVCSSDLVLDALDALDAVGPWDSAPLQDEQDPTDSLWRGARRAFNRGDYATAGKPHAHLARPYPDAPRARHALYRAAFALHKNEDLVRARRL